MKLTGLGHRFAWDPDNPHGPGELAEPGLGPQLMSGVRRQRKVAPWHMKPRVLTLPGWTNSGPQHWQTLWEAADSTFRRVEQRDWEYPDRRDWVETLDQAVAAAGSDVVLVAHSLGCSLIAHWAQDHPGRRVRGALLVAPSDPEQPDFSPQIRGFAPMPLHLLPFPSIVLTSSNDEYVTVERATRFATAWGSRYVNLGRLGHINSASGLGDWPDGRVYLDQLLALPAGLPLP